MKTNKNVEIANAIFKVTLLVIIKIVFILPNIIVFAIKAVESALKVVHKTITFLMESIQEEILK